MLVNGNFQFKIIPIYTDNPEQEIWNYIANFEIEKFVNSYLDKNRTSNDNINNFNNNNDNDFDREWDSNPYPSNVGSIINY
jgi:hypothetical protein